MLERIAAVRAADLSRPKRWQPSRLIVQNWWYYTYQEFHFVGGRLVLNGANGSGKSTVEALAVPVVLDMVKHRQRFDPFGGSEKHPSFYLLGLPNAKLGSVGYHDARIGYVVWEFQHGETDAYCTIGVGLMAKRSDGPEPPLESWGFVLPGRQLGEDFVIAADGDPFSRAALEQHIGREYVYRKANEYQAAVNEALFGFERPEDLRNLTDTLVELRKPKLVKDVSAEDLSASLRNALPALPRETGDRLAQLITNIDEAADALATTQDQIRRVAEIDAAQAQYANRLGQDAALQLQREAEILRRAVTRHEAVRRELAERRERLDTIAVRIQVLDGEVKTAEGTLEAKRSSDAYKSLESLEAAEGAQRSAEKACLAVEKSYELQVARLEALDTRRETLDGEFFGQVAELEARLDDMEDAATAAVWAAVTGRVGRARVALTKATVESEPGPADDPTAVLDEVLLRAEGREREEHLRALEGGLQAVAQAEQGRQHAEQKVSVAQLELRSSSEALGKAQDALVVRRDEAADAIGGWVESDVRPAADLILDSPLAETLGLVEEFTGDTHETGALVAPLAVAVREAERVAQAAATAAGRELSGVEHAHEEVIAERDALLARAFVPPPARPGQITAREALRAAGITAVPFYATVDFAAGVSVEAQMRLETALEAAGLLDALVVTPADRARALRAIGEAVSSDPASSPPTDRWLAPTAMSELGLDGVSGTLAASLVPIDGNGATAEVVDAVLRSVGTILDAPSSGGHAVGPTAVTSDGHWRLGVLEGVAGAASGMAVAPRYIGETNRRRRREEELQRLAARIAELAAVVESVRSRRDDAERTVETLRWARERLVGLPALRALGNAAMELRHARDHERRAASRVTEADQALEEARAQARQAAAAVEAALTPVPEARGLTRDQVIELRAATTRTLAEVREFGRELGRLDRLRAAEQRRRVERSAAARDAEDVLAQFWEARGAVQRAAAKAAAIRELLDGADALAIRTEVVELTEKIEELRRSIRTEEKALGEEKGRVEKLVERDTEIRDERVKAEGEYKAAAKRLEQRLQAYPEEGLRQALARFEDAAGGPDTAAAELLKRRRPGPGLAENIRSDVTEATNALARVFQTHLSDLTAFRPDLSAEHRVTFVTVAEQQRLEPHRFLAERRRVEEEQQRVVSEEEHQLYVDFFLNDVIAQIRRQVLEAEAFVREMNGILGEMRISNGASFRLTWEPRELAGPGAVNYAGLVAHVKRDPSALTAERRDAMLREFRQRVEAVRAGADARNLESYRDRLAAEFDYRTWFQFRFYFRKPGEAEFELRERGMGRLSGGERTLAQVLPLLAAVHARSLSARPDALKVFALDEPFAGVDAHNIQEVLEVLVRLEFSWIFAGESFWGDSSAVPGCASYLLRSQPGVVMAMLFVWDGTRRVAERDLRALAGALAAAAVAPATVHAPDSASAATPAQTAFALDDA